MSIEPPPQPPPPHDNLLGVLSYPREYLRGLTVDVLTATTFTVAAGFARDFFNGRNIDSPVQLSGDITVVGAGGLEKGTAEAADTWYAVHIIDDSRKNQLPNVLLSLSPTAPTLPIGFDIFRRVGWIRNDSGSDFLVSHAFGENSTKQVFYDESGATVSALTNGSAIVFTTVDLSEFLPPTSKMSILEVEFETGTAGASSSDTARIRPNGFTVDETIFRPAYGVKAADKGSGQMIMPTDGGQLVEYRVEGGDNQLNIEVGGYLDDL